MIIGSKISQSHDRTVTCRGGCGAARFCPFTRGGGECRYDEICGGGAAGALPLSRSSSSGAAPAKRAALGVLPTQGLRASAKRHGSGVMWGCGVIPLFFGLDPGFSYTRIFRFLDPKKTRFLWYLNQMLKWPYWAHFWSWSQS